ncbi:MAG TPA: ECF transporter S component [Synergistales bacterium]|nr:ECF transporter S component [Synergistales bacterium]
MINSPARKIALGALLSATVTISTILSIPVPGFRLYFNFGEGVIYTTALLLGPGYGAISGGLGAAMGDLILGYPLWAPFTLIIKGLEGFVVGRIGRTRTRLALLSGALVMITGYSSMAGILYGWKAAPVEMVTDLVQTGIGALFALLFVPLIDKRISGLIRGRKA